jgi:putative membrane protein
VLTAAILSTLHLLTLALGLGAVFMRGLALRAALDDSGWKRILAADTAWGIAALLWLATGLARVFSGGRGPSFYWHNGFFWLKIGLFAVVLLLELAPMITFIRVRIARRRGTALPTFSVRAYRLINTIEVVLIAAIVFAASLMARAVWMFA